MRVTLRWFYKYGNVPGASFHGVNHRGQSEDELIFRDHVSRDGGNDVAVIKGPAKVFSSVEAMNADQGTTPKFLVEYFLGNPTTEGRPLRALETGELARLLAERSKAPQYNVGNHAYNNANNQ